MAKKKAEAQPPVYEGALIEPLLHRPETVAIVALGRSSHSFIGEVMSKQGMKDPFDEVWACNRGIAGFKHDKVFCMDDLQWLDDRDEYYGKHLRNSEKPIFTSTTYTDFPMSVEYPIQEVLETIQDDIFTVNTISYMVAYAMHIGVKHLSIYGADFFYPNGSTAESGGQAVAYLLGIARERGMQFRLPQNTSLLYSDKAKFGPGGQPLGREWYGYHRKAELAEKRKKENDKS